MLKKSRVDGKWYGLHFLLGLSSAVRGNMVSEGNHFGETEIWIYIVLNDVEVKIVKSAKTPN